MEAYADKAVRFINATKAVHDYVKKLAGHAKELTNMKASELNMFADLARYPSVLGGIDSVSADRSTASEKPASESQDHSSEQATVDPANNDELLEKLAKEQNNSYAALPAWAATEKLRIEALEAAVNECNKCESRAATARKEAMKKRAEIDSIDAGKFNWRTVLSNNERKAVRRGELAKQEE